MFGVALVACPPVSSIEAVETLVGKPPVPPVPRHRYVDPDRRTTKTTLHCPSSSRWPAMSRVPGPGVEDSANTPPPGQEPAPQLDNSRSATRTPAGTMKEPRVMDLRNRIGLYG